MTQPSCFHPQGCGLHGQPTVTCTECINSKQHWDSGKCWRCERILEADVAARNAKAQTSANLWRSLESFEINGTPIRQMPSLIGRIASYGDLRAEEASKAKADDAYHRIATLRSALQAILARIDGNFDNEHLGQLGPLSESRLLDVATIAERAWRGDWSLKDGYPQAEHPHEPEHPEVDSTRCLNCGFLIGKTPEGSWKVYA